MIPVFSVLRPMRVANLSSLHVHALLFVKAFYLVNYGASYNLDISSGEIEARQIKVFIS